MSRRKKGLPPRSAGAIDSAGRQGMAPPMDMPGAHALEIVFDPNVCRNCGKIGYRSRREALRQASHFRRFKGFNQQPYLVEECGMWHLASIKPRRLHPKTKKKP